VLALSPDVVDRHRRPAAELPLAAGDNLVTSSWDIMAGSVKPAENVLAL
jgi:hypothetical protein